MIRVAIVDDDALVRAGLRTIFSSAEDLLVVGEAEDGSGVPELSPGSTPTCSSWTSGCPASTASRRRGD